MGRIILVDSKEQKPWVFAKSSFVERCEVQSLPTADYTVEGFQDLVLVERKGCVEELATNLLEARFEAELARLQKVPHPLVICEFELTDLLQYPVGTRIPKGRWRTLRNKGPFLLRRVCEMQVRYGVPFTFAGAKGKDFCLSFMKRVVEAYGEPEAKRKSRPRVS